MRLAVAPLSRAQVDAVLVSARDKTAASLARPLPAFVAASDGVRASGPWRMTAADWLRYDGRLRTERAAWIDSRLGRAPSQWRGRLRRQYDATLLHGGEVQANTWLRETSEAMPTLLLPLSASDLELRVRADELAELCLTFVGRMGCAGVVSAYRAAVKFCEAHGVEPPKVVDGEEVEIRAAVRRMTDPIWWRRRLRVHHGRAIEAGAIRLGYVHLRREKYVSDVNLYRRRQQKLRNAATLANVTATNQYGDEFTLAELAERSNANPHVRRCELLTRIRGFENIAKGVGHAADFWTLTCPSRFHAMKAEGGRNKNWSPETTPRLAQQHLVACFAKLRAWAQRKGVQWYGFRIVEPHHDGCPHWHVLLFMPPESVELAREGARKYFLDQHDANEPGAQDIRVKFKAIDWEEGSAVGYIIKYIAKNIDGYGVGKDLYGDDAIEASERVEAWSTTWGIRQFQQLGGAPVGVWRELRRLQASSQYTELVERARVAADQGSWAEYTALQGGPTVERRNLSLRAAMSRKGYVWCPVAQSQVPAMTTRYGEVAPPSVFGVRDMRDGLSFESRRFKWEVSKCGAKGVAGAGALAVTGFAGSAGLPSRKSGAGFGSPWTRVNNCTVGVSDGFGDGDRRGESRHGEELFGRQYAGETDVAAGCDAAWLAGYRSREAPGPVP